MKHVNKTGWNVFLVKQSLWKHTIDLDCDKNVTENKELKKNKRIIF